MELLEDFVEEIERICQTETDLSTKRNAFILLFHLDQQKALAYLKQLIANSDSDDDPIYEQGDIF
jgi:coatomer subunit beta